MDVNLEMQETIWANIGFAFTLPIYVTRLKITTNDKKFICKAVTKFPL